MIMKRKTKETTSPLNRYVFDWIMTYLPKQRLESPKTQKNYKLSIKLFLDYLESKGITNLTFACLKPDMINGWIQWMLEKRGNCAQTCNTRLAALKSFIKYIGVRDTTMKSLYYDISEYVENIKAPKRKVHGFSRAAITALFTVPDKSKKGIRDLAFMVLLYGAALRLDEILSIQIKHLHLDTDNPFVTIIGKRNILRSPYLLSGIVKHMNHYISVYHGDSPVPEDFLFYSPCGSARAKLSQESMRKRTKQIASKAHERCSEVPLSLHPHQFRHARAQHMLEDGISIAELSKYLGHSNIDTTMVYLDVSIEQMKKAIEKLENESNIPKIEKSWKGKSSEIAELRKSLGF